jgi:O-acetylhomoserine/O-acetylserine sulfhydrylase-like pyridoxal-dependent enzyme
MRTVFLHALIVISNRQRKNCQRVVIFLQAFAHLCRLAPPTPTRRWRRDYERSKKYLTKGAGATLGFGDDFIRLSVGIEDIEDILWDLGQALNAE